MKRYLCVFLIVCMALSLLVGCEGQPDASTGGSGSLESTGINDVTGTTTSTSVAVDPLEGLTLPTKQESYFEMLCENCSVNFYLRQSGWNCIPFFFIYSEDLADEKITITTNLGHTVEIEPFENNNKAEAFVSVNLLASYQGISWADVAADPEAYEDLFTRCGKAISTLQAQYPRLKSYKHMMTYGDFGIDPEGNLPELTQITSLTVTMGPHTKTYDVGELNFWNKKLEGNYGGGLTSSGGGGSMGQVMEPSTTGKVVLGVQEYTAKKDIVLQSLTDATGATLKNINCKVVIKPETGGMYSMYWDGCSPLEIDSGSQFQLTPEFDDPAMANVLTAVAIRYLKITYTSDGVEYHHINHFGYMVFPALAYAIYAWKVDGVDMLPYYVEYCNVETEQ